MLKENKKLKSSMIKEEKSRMTKLVAMAYENDPRVQFEEEKLRVEKRKDERRKINTENKGKRRGRTENKVSQKAI